MNESKEQIDELKALLKSRSDWHIWIIHMGISHAFIKLALHAGTYPRHFEIPCGFCERWETDVQGGPYALELRRTEGSRGDEEWELYSTDGTFRLVCGMIEPVRWMETVD